MSTKFVVDGDVSGASVALQKVETDVKKVGAAADKAGAEMDAAFDHANRIQDFKEQIDDLTAALQKAEQQAEKTNAEVGNPGAGKAGGDGAAKWASFLQSAGGAVQLAKAISDGFRVAREQIAKLAENGSVQAGVLNDALTRLSDSVSDMTQNLADSKEGSWFLNFLTSATNLASDAATHIDALDEGIAEWSANMAANAADLVGWTSAADAARDRAQYFREELDKVQQVEFAERVARQMQGVDKVFESFESKRQAQRQADEIEQIKSLDGITAKMNEQRAALEALAKSTTLTSKDKADAAKNLEALERRRLGILKEQAAAEAANKQAEKEQLEEAARIRQEYAEEVAKKESAAAIKAEEEQMAARREAAEKSGMLQQETYRQEQKLLSDKAKAQQDATDKRQKALEKAGTKEYAELDKAADEAEATADRIASAYEAAAQRRIDAEKRAADAAAAARQKEIDALADKQGTKDLAADINKQAGDPRAIRDRLAKNAEEAARKKAMEDGEVSSEERREIDQARRDAFRKATQQANGGPQAFNEQQIADAQKQNADAIIGSMQGAGKVGDKMVAALQQVVSATQATDQIQARQQQEIDYLMQLVGSQDQDKRRRAQRYGRSHVN